MLQVSVMSLSLPGRLSSKHKGVERDENLHYHPTRKDNNIITSYKKQISDEHKSRTPAQEALPRLREAAWSTPPTPIKRGGLMVSALVSGSRGPSSSPGRGHCVVFLGKTLYSHSASLHSGV